MQTSRPLFWSTRTDSSGFVGAPLLDLNSIAKPDRTFSLTLLDPASFLPLTADSGEEMTIVLRSQDSKEYQAEKRKQQNQTMKAAKFTRKLPRPRPWSSVDGCYSRPASFRGSVFSSAARFCQTRRPWPTCSQCWKSGSSTSRWTLPSMTEVTSWGSDRGADRVRARVLRRAAPGRDRDGNGSFVGASPPTCGVTQEEGGGP
jgi:hypothetical protein